MSRDDTLNQDEVESQLSAMFDGELPAAECELLSRRIDRDDNLRARWSRYALIGAAMRLEPVATARSDFSARVSAAVGRAATLPARRRNLVWQSVLAASLVGAVAGLSIFMLRSVTLGSLSGVPAAVAQDRTAGSQALAAAGVPATPTDALTRERQAVAVLSAANAEPGPRIPAASGPGADSQEPWSYVTPQAGGGGRTPLRTELVDYIVAHSEYSTPLMRPDLLSALISGEEGADSASPVAGATAPEGAPGAAAGGLDATIPLSAR